MIMALVLVALGWQSWRLNNASRTIETRGAALNSKTRELTKKNSQLIGLSILTETNSREQTRLYAAAEDTRALLHQRQNRIEELKREKKIYATGLTLFCLLMLSGCAKDPPLPEVQLTVSGCPKVTQCRPERSAPRSNGDLLTLLDETEAARRSVQTKWTPSCHVRSETVNKLQSLRVALNKSVAYVRENPDKLHLFVDKGSLVATGANSMSWEYRYTLNVVIEDFSGDQNLLMAPVLLWLMENQPDAINNPELREKLFSFEVDILRNDICDISPTCS